MTKIECMRFNILAQIWNLSVNGGQSRSRLSATRVLVTPICRRKASDLQGPDRYLVAYIITQQHPNHDGYTNNCQNFVQYLLNYACPGSFAPKTIQEFINDLFGFCQSSTSQPLPGTYPRSSVLSFRSESETWYSITDSSSVRYRSPKPATDYQTRFAFLILLF